MTRTGAGRDPSLPAPFDSGGRRDGHRHRPRWRLRFFLFVAGGVSWLMDASRLVRAARSGPWRAEVAQDSMAPALLPGDWLLLDPTCRRWPRPGSIVVVREPGTGVLAIKRVAARGRCAAAPLPGVPRLARREAWLLGDAAGASIDSRTYGPVDEDDLVARAWFRYGPLRRVGLLRAANSS